MLRFFIGLATVLIPICASAQATKSAQQLYNEATAAFQSANWQDANNLYAALQAKVDISTPNGAIVAVRRGVALQRLGRGDEAIPLLEEALPRLATKGFEIDQTLGNSALANLYEGRQLSALAFVAYRRALTTASVGVDRFAITAGLIRTQMFTANADAQATGKRAVQAAEEMNLSSEQAGYLRALYGRALLVGGQLALARDQLQKAVVLSGGYGRSLTPLNISIRADAGLAALIARDEKSAHTYLAYAGNAVETSGDLPLPDLATSSLRCGGEILERDMAIVEFGIDARGVPVNAKTIYMNRLGEGADRFASTVMNWRWKAATVARIGPVRRLELRVELRCSRQGLNGPSFTEEINAWAIANSAQPFARSGPSDPEALLALARSELGSRERAFGHNSIQLVPVLEFLQYNDLVDLRESMAIERREQEILLAAGMPPVLQVLVAYRLAVNNREISDADRVSLFRGMLSKPPFNRDKLAQARLKLFISKTSVEFTDESRRLLEDVANDGDVPDDASYKREAMSDLIEIYHRSLTPADIDKYVRRLGAGPPSCIAVIRNYGKEKSNGYPDLPQQWGMSGWVQTESDIGPRNVVVSSRVLAAYPPIVFSDAARKMVIAEARTLPVESQSGCVNAPRNVSFVPSR